MKPKLGIIDKYRPMWEGGKSVEKYNIKVGFKIRMFVVSQLTSQKQKNPNLLNQKDIDQLTQMIMELKEDKSTIPPEQQTCTLEEYKKFLNDFFNKVDYEDRHETVTIKTTSKFRLMASFIDVLISWGPIDNEMIKCKKYCQFKAVDIFKALKRGEIPKRGGPKEQNNEENENTQNIIEENKIEKNKENNIGNKNKNIKPDNIKNNQNTHKNSKSNNFNHYIPLNDDDTKHISQYEKHQNINTQNNNNNQNIKPNHKYNSNNNNEYKNNQLNKANTINCNIIKRNPKGIHKEDHNNLNINTMQNNNNNKHLNDNGKITNTNPNENNNQKIQKNIREQRKIIDEKNNEINNKTDFRQKKGYSQNYEIQNMNNNFNQNKPNHNNHEQFNNNNLNRTKTQQNMKKIPNQQSNNNKLRSNNKTNINPNINNNNNYHTENNKNTNLNNNYNKNINHSYKRKSLVVPSKDGNIKKRTFKGKYRLTTYIPVKYNTVPYFMLIENVRINNDNAMKLLKRGKTRDVLNMILDSLDFLSYVHK